MNKGFVRVGASSGGSSSVDEEGVAGDHGDSVGSEEGDGAGDFVRLADVVQGGDPLQRVGLDAGSPSARHRCT